MASIVELNENQKIIISMTDQLADLTKIKIRLIFLSEAEKANEILAKYNTLSDKIDELIANEMHEWNIEKEATLIALNKTNNKIDDAIDKIEKKVKIAENVVKALKQADKVIEIATDIISKIP
ncbi:MAG: hypothetical protein PHI97_29185 [Desulfobulbus sp.]|nr:hypothetical protein [Desulfobulbus sp.]